MFLKMHDFALNVIIASRAQLLDMWLELGSIFESAQFTVKELLMYLIPRSRSYCLV